MASTRRKRAASLLSPQSDPDNDRLRREAEAVLSRLSHRIDELEVLVADLTARVVELEGP